MRPCHVSSCADEGRPLPLKQRTGLHHELLSLQAEAIAAINKEAQEQERDLQIRRKELQIEQLHVQLQALSTAKGEERLKAMAKCNELNTMEQMDTDQLKIFAEKEVAIADNEATIVRSNNKVDITRSNNERKVKLGTNQGAINIARSNNEVDIARSNNETKVMDGINQVAIEIARSEKPKVRFGHIDETTFVQEPGDSNLVYANNKFPFCTGGSPLRLGSDVVSKRSYPCPENASPGRTVPVGTAQRKEMYKHMTKEQLIEHIFNLSQQNQTLTSDNQCLTSKNFILEGRINTVKTFFLARGGEIADNLWEQLRKQQSRCEELEFNYNLLVAKFEANHEENKRYRKELLQAARGITVKASKKDNSGNKIRPVKWVGIYPPNKKRKTNI